MGTSFKSDETVRDYLLGRVSDEATLEGLEERLFTDEEFCSRVALAEDELINDYVLGYLNEEDAAAFDAALASNPERRFKLELTRALREKALAASAQELKASRESKESKESKPMTAMSETTKTTAPTATDAGPSLFESLKAFFRRPIYAGAFAVLLVAILSASVYLFRSGGRADELAELRAIYGRERPTETRISEFAYAPLAQMRGEPEERDRGRLRLIENRLIEEKEKSPNAQTRHALGVFYLTQQKYADAAKELESASKSDERDARIHNDLGAAYFGLAKSSAKEKRLESLGRALEEFTRATELDAGSLEALFNKSLALQELGLPRQAKESWTLYLEKDSSSPWAEEARKNLARLDDARVRFKTDEKILEEETLRDFLEAYRARDDARARAIHDATKGLLRGPAVAQQLSLRYLSARLGGDDAAAKESLAALTFVGAFERARHSEFFFLSSRTSTRASRRTRPSAFSERGVYSTRASVYCSAAARAS